MTYPASTAPKQEFTSLLRQHPIDWSLSTPLQRVEFEPFALAGVTLDIKREDLINPELSGNKLYKLHGHLSEAVTLGASRLVSFGGYYSNHLHALAFAGNALGIATKGVIRGNRPKELSPTLLDCLAQNMELEFVSRNEYRELNSACLKGAHKELGKESDYWIPEGGASDKGVIGCCALVDGIRYQLSPSNPKTSFTAICLPVGTGTTAAGVLSRLNPEEHAEGYCALKFGAAGISATQAAIVDASGNPNARFKLHDEDQFGGFAKVGTELTEFMADFYKATGISLDPLYTGKMLYKMTKQVSEGYWRSGSHLVAVHTGGLQGRRGFPQLPVEHT